MVTEEKGLGFTLYGCGYMPFCVVLLVAAAGQCHCLLHQTEVDKKLRRHRYCTDVLVRVFLKEGICEQGGLEEVNRLRGAFRKPSSSPSSMYFVGYFSFSPVSVRFECHFCIS